MRRTKIICTLGPATDSSENILRLAQSGMNIARLNFSHGTREQHGVVIDRIQELNRTGQTTIGIMLDTKGCEIRTGEVAQPLKILAGEEVVFSFHPLPNETRKVIRINYEGFAKDVAETDRILLDNGYQQYDIIAIQESMVIGRAKEDGTIGSRRHINLPGAYIDLPSLTESDWKDIAFGCEKNLDFVALSFIRCAKEVEDARAFIGEKGGHMQLIAKVETKQAVENLHAIIAASDGIMVARGDLGAEIPFELIPAIQDEIVERCRETGKISIVATQMLESMIDHPMPTRAEVTDVAHAAVTRTDATMLSGESAVGKHPFLCLDAMHRIIVETENRLPPLQWNGEKRESDTRTARAVAAVEMARSIDAKAIIVLTQSGKSAEAISSLRPLCPILAFTGSETTVQHLTLRYGVIPFYLALNDNDPETSVQAAINAAKERGFVALNNRIILVADSKVTGGVVCSVQIRTIT